VSLARAACLLLLAACTVRRSAAPERAPAPPPTPAARFHCFGLTFPSGVAALPCARSLADCEQGRAASLAAGWPTTQVCASRPTAWCLRTADGQLCDATLDSCLATRRGASGYRGACYEIDASWPAPAPGRAPFHCTTVHDEVITRTECYRSADECELRFHDIATRHHDATPCVTRATVACYVASSAGERCAPDLSECEARRAQTGGEPCAVVVAN
jgi:hypothetical protein